MRHECSLTTGGDTSSDCNYCQQLPGLCGRPHSGHRCHGSNGTYTCDCSAGYEKYHHVCMRNIETNNGTFIFSTMSGIVMGSNDKDMVMLYPSANDEGSSSIFTCGTFFSCIQSTVDYNWHKNYISWAATDISPNAEETDKDDDTVNDPWAGLLNRHMTIFIAKMFADKQSALDFSDVKALVKLRCTRVSATAIDWIHDVIYVACDNHIITVNPFNANTVKIYSSGSNLTEDQKRENFVRHLIVDPINDKVIWSNASYIKTTNLNGSNVRTFDSQGQEIRGLAVDIEAKLIYTLETLEGNNGTRTFVRAINYDGVLSHVFAIAIENEPWGNGLFTSSCLFAVFKDDIVLPGQVSINKYGVPGTAMALEPKGELGKLVHSSLQPAA
ncbi:hypothetical protein HDE_06918 [Halotydeus destructor]|nr:hypothetical protein HDE_06918 [Halotydeus destructor]